MENNENKSQKDRWIVDTDPGCDDLIAMIYLMNRPETEIEFITLTEGNAKIKDVKINIKKMFWIIGKEYPVYIGCQQQLSNHSENAYDYHYEDGLGGIKEIMDINVDNININSDQNYSAKQIIKAVNKSPGQLNLLALAPLTNIAIALKLDPSIKNKFKNIVCMGGSYSSTGNITPSAEFNFYFDSLASQIFFSKFTNVLICPWEPTFHVYFDNDKLARSKDIAIQKWGSYNEKIYFYMQLIIKKYSNEKIGCQICDLYAIICYYCPESVSEFFLSEQKIIIDSEVMRGSLYCVNKESVKCSFEKYFKDYYLQNKSIDQNSQNKNIYVSDINKDSIVGQFAYILRP
jgi:inosine-uridine nucleoside N-ribohydrolase